MVSNFSVWTVHLKIVLRGCCEEIEKIKNWSWILLGTSFAFLCCCTYSTRVGKNSERLRSLSHELLIVVNGRFKSIQFKCFYLLPTELKLSSNYCCTCSISTMPLETGWNKIKLLTLSAKICLLGRELVKPAWLWYLLLRYELEKRLRLVYREQEIRVRIKDDFFQGGKLVKWYWFIC